MSDAKDDLLSKIKETGMVSAEGFYFLKLIGIKTAKREINKLPITTKIPEKVNFKHAPLLYRHLERLFPDYNGNYYFKLIEDHLMVLHSYNYLVLSPKQKRWCLITKIITQNNEESGKFFYWLKRVYGVYKEKLTPEIDFIRYHLTTRDDMLIIYTTWLGEIKRALEKVSEDTDVE